MRIWTTAGMAMMTLLLVGCQSGKAASAAAPGMVNDTCPFSGRSVGAGAPVASWEGQNVGFCCNGCASRWAGWSDDQKQQYVAAHTE